LVSVTPAGRLAGQQLVRSFTSDGKPVGMTRLWRASLAEMFSVDGRLPAPNGGAWLVMSSRKNFELIPVH
jgi:hypothetical protein